MGKALVHRLREDAGPILDDEAVGMAARQRFPELLQCPFRRGMGRGAVVENLAGSNLYHEEDIEGSEGGVITTKKSQATMTLAWWRTKLSQRCFGSGVRTGLGLRRLSFS
jgi:hypothetical protein